MFLNVSKQIILQKFEGEIVLHNYTMYPKLFYSKIYQGFNLFYDEERDEHKEYLDLWQL